MNPTVQPFFDPATWTVTYVVDDQPNSACAIIDPVLDYDPKSGRTRTDSVDKVVAFVREQGLQVQWILETHAHADHLTAAPYLRRELGGQISIGSNITQVQDIFKKVFNLGPEFRVDGSQFDRLLAGGETVALGLLEVHALSVPGHTPSCMAYQVGDAVFIGDTLFMPDVGTARCDFPGGDATTLYRSVRKLLALPSATRLFMCHDHPPGGRELKWESTVADQRAGNIHIHDGVTQEQFTAMRTARDATLEMPNLMLPAIQVNIQAGQMPPVEANGTSYLKVPLNLL